MQAFLWLRAAVYRLVSLTCPGGPRPAARTKKQKRAPAALRSGCAYVRLCMCVARKELHPLDVAIAPRVDGVVGDQNVGIQARNGHRHQCSCEVPNSKQMRSTKIKLISHLSDSDGCEIFSYFKKERVRRYCSKLNNCRGPSSLAQPAALGLMQVANS